MTQTAASPFTPGRQRVLDGALQLFSERGFAGTSMRDLADHLQLQPASVYTHYRGGKDDLLRDALAPLLDGLDHLLAVGAHLSTEADLQLWLHNYAQLLATDHQAARIAGADLAVARHPRIGSRLAQQNAQARALLTHRSGCSDTMAASALGALWWPYICLLARDVDAGEAAMAAERTLAPHSRGRQRGAGSSEGP